jgi:hypothetical protein
MQTTEDRPVSAGSVNYDDTPIVQLQVEEVDYRVDTGLGSAVAVSRWQEGSWEWAPVTEGRWDGTRLRAKGLDFPVVTALAAALAQAMRDQSECS